MSTHHVNFCCYMDHTNVAENFKPVIMSSNDNLKTLRTNPGKVIQKLFKTFNFSDFDTVRFLNNSFFEG